MTEPARYWDSVMQCWYSVLSPPTAPTQTDRDWRGIAVKLWRLLDNIDTLDDAWREDDAGFRKSAYETQRRRFEVLSGEAYDEAIKAEQEGMK